MSPTDEHRLYLRDRAAWARYIAPRWYERMKRETEAEKRESWRIAGPELKAEIRRLAQADQSQPEAGT